MRSSAETVLNALDASANQASLPIDVSQAETASAQAVITGSAAGTLKMQYSNDIVPDFSAKAVVNWSDIPSASVSISGAGVYGIFKIDLSYNWLRLVYTVTSGSGSISAIVKTNGF